MTHENCMKFRRGVCSEASRHRRTCPLTACSRFHTAGPETFTVWLTTDQPATPGRGASSVPRPPLEALGRGSLRRGGFSTAKWTPGPGRGREFRDVCDGGLAGRGPGVRPPRTGDLQGEAEGGKPGDGGESDGSFWAKTLGPVRMVCVGDLAMEATGNTQMEAGDRRTEPGAQEGQPQSQEGLRLQR